MPADEVRVAYAADMRYVGQAYELEVPIAVPVTPERMPEILAAFHAVHERVYGYARTQQPVEFVNFRAVHTLPAAAAGGDAGGPRDRRAGRRARWASAAPTSAAFVPTAIYERARLPARRAPGRPGHRRAERHDHRDPTRRHRAASTMPATCA